jgi:hypothetical protein
MLENSLQKYDTIIQNLVWKVTKLEEKLKQV